MQEPVQKIEKKFKGIVVSASMDKSITIRVDTLKWHTKYKKQYKSSKKYIVHDEKSECEEGDVVQFVGCRPLSKNKRWRLLNIVEKAAS